MKHFHYDTVLCESLEQPVLGISRLSPCDSWERPQALVTLNWLSRRGWMNGWMCEIDEPMLCLNTTENVFKILNCVFFDTLLQALCYKNTICFPYFCKR